MAEFEGTNGADRLVGTAGADTMSGGLGRDRINGGDGADVIHGGADNDYVYGDRDDDILYGGDGNDVVVGDHGNDIMFGDDGDDGMFGGGNDDRIDGGAGNDNLNGDGGNDIIVGGLGNDRINGGSGNDTIIYRAGDGADTVVGNSGVDTLQLVMSADDAGALRADIAAFAAWRDAHPASAGATTGESFTFQSIGLTISTIEVVEFVVDGVVTAIEDLLNAAPVVDARQEIATREDVEVRGVVAATDPDGDALTMTLAHGAAHGSVTLDAATGHFTYVPDVSYAGSDSFEVVVTDSAGESATQRIDVTVTPVADQPLLAVQDVVSDAASQHIVGTAGADRLVGTMGGDVIAGGAGNDVILADGDACTTGSGVEIALDIAAELTDLDGSETLVVEISGVPAGATLSAGEQVTEGVWRLDAAALENLTLSLASPADVTLAVTATAQEAGGDAASVTSQLSITFDNLDGVDYIAPGAGNDTVIGGHGVDVLDYSQSQCAVAAYLYAGFALAEGVDEFSGIEGVIGSRHGDVLFGTDGDNIIMGGAGGDLIYGFDGDDTIDGGDGGDSLYGYGGDDTISDGAGADLVYGDAGNDRVIAAAGNDRDSYYGGSGVDVIDYSAATGGISIDLNSGQVRGAAGNDVAHDFENVAATDFADVIEGSSAVNVIDAGAGDDVVIGGRGSDILTGGAGADTFSYGRNDITSGRTHHGMDRITDFGATDRLDFDDLIPSSREHRADDYIRMTETAEGTVVSVDLGTSAGFVDVVLLENVFDLDLDQMLASGQIHV